MLTRSYWQAGLSAFLLVAVSARTSAQTITALPHLPGGTYMYVDAISDDGNTLCGDGTVVGGSARAWRWTAVSGIQNLGVVPGADHSYGYGMSGNGQVVVGASGLAYDTACRWTAATGLLNLGALASGQPSFGFDANFDGSIVFGFGYDNGSMERAFRWTSANGMQPFGQLLPGTGQSVGIAVTSDASAAIGYCYNNAPALVYPSGCIWNAVGSVTSIGVLAGALQSVPGAISNNGQVVVGYCSDPITNNYLHAFRWTVATGIQDIGQQPGIQKSVAASVNADGSMIGGYSIDATGNPVARIWVNGSTASQDLNSYFQGRGINTTGWLFRTVLVSANGMALAGTGTHNGTDTAWYVLLGQDCTSAPTITTQPVSQSVPAGSTFSFSVGATGGTLAYQWFRNTNAIIGAIGPVYTVASAASTDVGTYYCTVTSNCGTTPSGVATLDVTSGCPLPVITAQPASVSAILGATTAFTVAATSSTGLDYQWRWNQNDIAGANDSTLEVDPVQLESVGSYDCAITNDCGTVYSMPAYLSIPGACNGVYISSPPASQSSCESAGVTLSVVATGTGPIAYQWQRESALNSGVFVSLADGSTTSWDGGGPAIGAIVTGAQSDALHIHADTQNGRHLSATHARQYRCLASNGCGSAASQAAALIVLASMPGDVNDDGAVNGADMQWFVNLVGTGSAPGAGFCAADLNKDGSVDAADLPEFINRLLGA